MEQDFDLEALDPLFECPTLYYSLVSPESDNQTTPSDNERMSLDCLSSPSQSGESPHLGSLFSPEEDDMLRHLAVEFDFDWPRIARLIPNKTPAQVAKRWACKLDPSIKKTRWSVEEDRKIDQLQQTYGNNWKLIAQHLPGRPPAAVKSRYYNSIRKRGESTKDQPKVLDRNIRQMVFPFAPAATPPALQCIDKVTRITSLRKQLAGMEVLMAKTKAEISKLQEKSQQICD